MYIYFDSNGYLKEFINDPKREGSQNVNKLYIYIEPSVEDVQDKTIDNQNVKVWMSLNTYPSGTADFRLMNLLNHVTDNDGNILNTLSFNFEEDTVYEAIPYNKDRDLKYFVYGRYYQFIKLTIPSEVLLSSGEVSCSLSLVNPETSPEDQYRFVLDIFTFIVQDSVVKKNINITQAEYAYLLSTKIGIANTSLLVTELPETGRNNIFYVLKSGNEVNIYIWNGSSYVWIGSNQLNLSNYYTKAEGEGLEAQIQSVANGSPKGVYDSVEGLTTAHPTGDNNIYLVGTHWYYWNGTAWTDGGEYLSSGEDVEILKEEMANLWILSDNVYDKSTDTANKYIDTEGVLQDNTNFSTSDFIDIPFDGDNYMYINAQNVASEYNDYKGIYSYALYDEDKTFISRSSMAAARITGFNNSTNHAKYIRIVVGKNTVDLMVTFKNTYDTSYDPDYIPYGGEIAEPLKENIEEIASSLYDTITENKEDIPLKHLIYNGGMTNIFRTIGVVGDSLSSGCMEKNDQTGVDMYEYSWIQTIGRLCGSTAFNFSVGGLSSKNFWTTNNAYVKHLRDKDPNYKCQAYFIALGVNDIADTSIDVGTASDINNDESTTFYGYYSRIIKLIQEVQPRAKIFLVGLPNHPAMTVWGSRFTNFKNAIADMVNYFDNCYYLNLFTYDVLYDNDFRDIYFNGFHENALGYLRSAWVISTYCDWIIRHNYEDFREVAFIGTNYHYYTE